jgi:Erv1 / Alr family
MTDFTKYHGASGLATKKWGPPLWVGLFSCIMGGYPVHLDPYNKEHKEIKKHFKNMFESFAYTMPCVFCRNSYKIFVKDIPMEPFMKGRIEMMYWLYLIRDKVNNKLIAQELKCFNDEKKRLKNLVYAGRLSEAEYYQRVEAFRQETLVTQLSPPFEEVLEKYEAMRAVCSAKAATCALPKKE